jgi:hypothetical protein
MGFGIVKTLSTVAVLSAVMLLSTTVVDPGPALGSFGRVCGTATSDMACSIKGNVKRNTFPMTEREGEFLDFQPLYAGRHVLL